MFWDIDNAKVTVHLIHWQQQFTIADNLIKMVYGYFIYI